MWRLWVQAMGVQTLMINAPTMTLLAARAQNLHHHLRHRGHASLLDITASDKNLPWQSDKLPSPIKKARSHPNHSSLTDNDDDKTALRSDLAQHLAEILVMHLQRLDINH